jgi:hypothetical protein
MYINLFIYKYTCISIYTYVWCICMYATGFGEGYGLYARMLEMRQVQNDVMAPKKRRSDMDSGMGGGGETANAPPNVYAGNLAATLRVCIYMNMNMSVLMCNNMYTYI